MKLTGPNRSIGLIPCAWRQVRPTPNLISNTSDGRPTVPPGGPRCRPGRRAVRPNPTSRATVFFDDLVVMARGEAPDPIPNSAVKTLSADGTAS